MPNEQPADLVVVIAIAAMALVMGIGLYRTLRGKGALQEMCEACGASAMYSSADEDDTPEPCREFHPRTF